MAVEKLSVSFDPELGDAVRSAAEDDDESVSAWLAEAARERLRNVALRHAVAELVEQAGLSDAELTRAGAEAEAAAFWSDATPVRRKRRTPKASRR